MLLCSFTKKKTGSIFPAFCHCQWRGGYYLRKYGISCFRGSCSDILHVCNIRYFPSRMKKKILVRKFQESIIYTSGLIEAKCKKDAN